MYWRCIGRFIQVTIIMTKSWQTEKFDRVIPYARLNFCVLAFPVPNAFFSSDMTAELCYEVTVRFVCLVSNVFKLKISAIQLRV